MSIAQWNGRSSNINVPMSLSASKYISYYQCYVATLECLFSHFSLFRASLLLNTLWRDMNSRFSSLSCLNTKLYCPSFFVISKTSYYQKQWASQTKDRMRVEIKTKHQLKAKQKPTESLPWKPQCRAESVWLQPWHKLRGHFCAK